MTGPASRWRVLAAAGLLTLLSACSGTNDTGSATEPTSPDSSATSTTASSPAPTTPPPPHKAAHPSKPGKLLPLRQGEDRLTLTMPQAYTPTAPTGVGTDDYRCFLLDPKLDRDSFLTGINVAPGNPDVVHHVILFKVPADKVAAAKAKDAETPDQGWTCFGGSGLDSGAQIDDAQWLGAWAPGGDETMTRDGYGVELSKGSQIVMQVHYNLLAQVGPDMSSTQIRVMPDSPDLTPLHTYLMPAPVELPCRKGHDASPLCDRDAALANARERFGASGGVTAQVLHALCQTDVTPGNTQSCTRTIGRGMTILGAAGHMHLLGRQIKIEVNPGTPQAKTVLDIPLWDFDDQGARRVDSIHLNPFDTVKVTCKHVQWLRDQLPSFQGQDEKYVVWGEGTTDEMCLGMLSVAYDN